MSDFRFKASNLVGWQKTFDVNVQVGTVPYANYSSTEFDYLATIDVQGRLVADMLATLFEMKDVQQVEIRPYSIIINASMPWNKTIDEIVQTACKAIFDNVEVKDQMFYRFFQEDTNNGILNLRANFRLSINKYQRFLFPLRESSDQYLKLLGPEGEKLVRGLMQLKGITIVEVKPFSLTVTIGGAFNWNEAQDDGSLFEQVQKAVQKTFGEQVEFAPDFVKI